MLSWLDENAYASVALIFKIVVSSLNNDRHDFDFGKKESQDQD